VAGGRSSWRFGRTRRNFGDVPSTNPDRCDPVVTWHHGLIARWWANFNLDGPEIEFFGQFVKSGQPALDAACGTGRLLVPWVTAGLDVDGVDVSADMIASCREAADRAGRSPTLYVQPLHHLDIPRRYRCIVVCGGFGLGTTREQDVEALRRLFAHLEPSGLLALDYEVEEFDAERWRTGRPVAQDQTPPDPGDRRLGSDGFQYALRNRVVAVDHDTRRVTYEIQAWQWSDGELVAHETHALTANVYTSEEILNALHEAGAHDVEVVGGYHGGQPTGREKFLVYLTRQPVPAP
jgi:SAM-dependent methyltransferase